MISIKKLILKYFPLHKFLSFRSYSQEGEDMVIRSFYEGLKNYKGFYIDVGAHHPYRFSNTKYFYNKGWTGINIEPSPEVMPLFDLFRRRDINLNIGISSSTQYLEYYCFDEPALNGFSKELSEERSNVNSHYNLIKTISVKTSTLKDVLDEYLPHGQRIDFLNIDAEGFDLIVLQSNNWTLYRPKFVLVEDKLKLVQLDDSEVYTYMIENGYELIAKTLRTLIFKDIMPG